MSSTPRAITTEAENLLQRVKNGFGEVFFALIQHSPKLLALHRNEKAWTLFRFVLGCFGAALVVLPLSLWKGYITALFGLAAFVVSILLPPAELESDTDRKAHELGAHTVVSGGEYQAPDGRPAEVQLFISPVHVWAMDKNLEPRVVITTGEISTLRLEASMDDDWVLTVRWNVHRADFIFKGIFAERYARLAEESLRQASSTLQPTPGKRRAASA
jgi:hypothetical protein